MTQGILNVEFNEILRAFTTGAKNEGFRLLFPKGLKVIARQGVLRTARCKTLCAHRETHWQS